MSIETYQFNLPITPGAIPPVLHLSQYDSGRTFTAILRDDANVPFELDSGATAVIKGRNAAGIAWQQDCTVSGANVTFTPSGAATDQFGVMPVTIEITESDEIISPLCVVFHIQKAGYTNEEAVLSPDFETAIQAAVAQAISEGGLGFSDEFKEALLACFNGVAWATTGGQALVDDLEAALYPDVHLVSITAAYDQDRPIYDTDSLDIVKLDLVVTANYSDGTSEQLADDAYTLTGTLTVGTSTITVGYEGKTAEISVVVTSGMVCDILTLDGIKNTRDGHDSSSTVWEDLSGNENDFAVIDGSAPVWGDKYAGFDATNRALGLTKDLFGSDKTVSVELVLKITGNGSAQDGSTYLGGIFTSREYDTSANGIDLYSYNANGMSAYWKSNNLGYTGSIGDKIVYLCFVFDGSSCTKYLNGSSVSTNTVNDWNASTTRRSDFRIGRTTGYAKNFYPSANIYRIGIHSSAFSAQDVADRYAFYASRFGITE